MRYQDPLDTRMDPKPFGYSWEELMGHWDWMPICSRCYRGPLSELEMEEDINLCKSCEQCLDVPGQWLGPWPHNTGG